ncbi:MAG: hypothetical protein WBL65_10115 [Bryobacteraceae bacterium]
MKHHVYLLLALAWTPAAGGAAAAPATYRIETVAGSANMGDGGPATSAQISTIQGIAIDRWGNLYLSDTGNHRVRKISTSGFITTLAGTGVAGFSGDGGPATAAQLNLPYGLAADLAGYVYVADLNNDRVRRIGPDGVITTVAGNGIRGSSGDGGAATSAPLLTPRNVVVDAAGNFYFSEFDGHRVRKVTPGGIISTVAGTGVAGFSGDGFPAVNAQLDFPAGLAVDRLGALYIADSQNHRVRKILAGGIISTVLGGSPSTALGTPVAVAVDMAGTLYVADISYADVHSYTGAGAWTILPGLSAPHDLALDLSGVLYVADGTHIRNVVSGQMQTVAGDGYVHAIGDGGLATDALLSQPSAIALNGAGSLYIADTGTQRVRQVLPTGVIQTLAGTGVAGTAADNVVASAATLNSPMGIALDAAGDILIADTNNHRIRQVAADGRIHNLVGTGVAGVGAEGLPPAQTQLNLPSGVCTGRGGTLFVVDTFNNRVLQAAPQPLVVNAAGNASGIPGADYAGDGGSARLAHLNRPSACALDSAGNLFIADTLNHSIRKVDPSGTISTVAGTGAAGFSGDQGPATAAGISAPAGVVVDDDGDIFIADTGNNRIRQVTPDGVIHTIAGQNAAGFSGDGGLAASAQIDAPGGLLLDGAGDLYFADTGNNRVRRLVPQDAPPAGLVALPPLSAVSAASLLPGPVAPGEIIVIFGAGLGPESGVAGALDSSGVLANLLSGAEVRFDGVPAPLFYAQFGQINVQVPYTVAGNTTTHVQALYQGVPSGSLDLAVVSAAPALFPVVANPDGSPNSATDPTALGSILTFYATGEGLTNGPNLSGQAATAPYPSPVLPVTLTVAGFPAQILYAGSAPGAVGLLQVNARVPAGFIPTGPVAAELAVGSAVAPDLTIWLK